MLFNRFYLDKEKDIIVDLYQEQDNMLSYVLSTPNHHTGNLITNLARLCHLPVSFDDNGLKIIKGELPCLINGYNESLYVFRLGGIKVANIYPDGHINMKASIPAISKTLMSQTKHYNLPINKTILKSYLLSDCKFRTDLHTHMNAVLSPDLLIALGIYHQIRYPLYYIKKLGLKLSEAQQKELDDKREEVAKRFVDSPLTGKYLTRRIDDNTFINFASLMLQNDYANYNIPRIRASLAIMKDGQAVFTNIEKVYLYRYVFTKGVQSEDLIDHYDIALLPDKDIQKVLKQMHEDHKSLHYQNNTLFQDKLLWIARTYQSQGIEYIEISDTTLVKKEATSMLEQVHAVMPYITADTGILIRFLAGIRRIPLTIVRDNITPNDYLNDNMQVLRAIAQDPYVAGSDILGEEINDIREVAPVIKEIVSIAKDYPDFVIRIHAGENDCLRDNVANSISCVKDALEEGQIMPHVRIGHGLYTSNLKSARGKQLLKDIVNNNVTLEFQMTSNVRLNNLSLIDKHPLKQYLKAGVLCVQGTDGCALYGTNSIDEQLALTNLLNLNTKQLLQMRNAEERVKSQGLKAFNDKMNIFNEKVQTSVADYYSQAIDQIKTTHKTLIIDTHTEDAQTVFKDQIATLPIHKTPIIVAGGSFNNDNHRTIMREEYKALIDELVESVDPQRYYFVIGHCLTGYERYLLQHNTKCQVYAFVPSQVDLATVQRIKRANVKIRVAIEPVSMGLYKSIAYEIFKRTNSVLIALDGNSAGANLIQEAKNGKKKCRLFVNPHSKMLKEKATSLQGYVTLLDNNEEVLKWTK